MVICKSCSCLQILHWTLYNVQNAKYEWIRELQADNIHHYIIHLLYTVFPIRMIYVCMLLFNQSWVHIIYMSRAEWKTIVTAFCIPYITLQQLFLTNFWFVSFSLFSKFVHQQLSKSVHRFISKICSHWSIYVCFLSMKCQDEPV